MEAHACLTDALHHQPSSTHLRLQLAQLQAVRGRRSQATALAAAAPAAAPQDADAHAIAVLGAGQMPRGAAAQGQAAGLVEVLRCDPGAIEALFGTIHVDLFA